VSLVKAEQGKQPFTRVLSQKLPRVVSSTIGKFGGLIQFSTDSLKPAQLYTIISAG